MSIISFGSRRPRPVLDGPVVVREATPDDAPEVRRLAERDSAPIPEGRLLIAEAAGEIRAALPLAGGAPIADPFSPTAELVSLLELRAAQLRGTGRRRARAPVAQSAPTDGWRSTGRRLAVASSRRRTGVV